MEGVPVGNGFEYHLLDRVILNIVQMLKATVPAFG
jgi:hypothetical protein